MKRKILWLLMLFSAGILPINCQTNAPVKKVKPCKYLSFAEAEKILGGPVELITNSWTFTNGTARFDCNYRAIKQDEATGSEINLFFMLEELSSAEQAQAIYEEIRRSNADQPKFEKLADFGDEGFSQNDLPNFFFLMARKGKFTIRVKVNRAVETTSFEESKAWAKKVLAGI